LIAVLFALCIGPFWYQISSSNVEKSAAYAHPVVPTAF
jgi:hypothetical protein